MPPARCPFLILFGGEGSPTKIDYRKSCSLSLTSLLEDLGYYCYCKLNVCVCVFFWEFQIWHGSSWCPPTGFRIDVEHLGHEHTTALCCVGDVDLGRGALKFGLSKVLWLKSAYWKLSTLDGYLILVCPGYLL